MNSTLRTMSDDDLDSAILATTIALETAKTKLSLLLFELQSRVKDDVMHDFAAAGKDSGTMTIHRGNRKYKAEIRKTVSWDSDKLQAVAAGMPWNAVERLFDIKFSVAEGKFNAISDDELLAKIMEARTTKLSELKVVPL